MVTAKPMIPDGFYYFGNVKVLKKGKTIGQKTIRADK